MNKKVLAVTTVTALVIVAVAWVVVRHGRAEAVAVAAGPIQEVVVAQGQVVAVAGTADVRALVDGRVVEVAVREGDAVTAGQLLARLDTAEIDAAIARAEAERNVAAAELRLAQAGGRAEERRAAEAELTAVRAALAMEETRASRDSELADSGAVPVATADDSRRTAEIARARVARAEAQRNGTLRGRVEQVDAARARLAVAAAELEAARARRERSVVVAPIAGVVLARHVDVGDTTAPGATLFELADPAATELRIEVEELEALRLATGLGVEITSPGGRETLGRGAIVRLSPQLGRRTIGATDARVRAEAQVRSAWVRWETPPASSPAGLPIGLRVEARVELPPRQVTARVPRRAVRVRDGHAQVELPGWHLFADERTVVLGATDAHWVEVSGVSPGTRVVSAP